MSKFKDELGRTDFVIASALSATDLYDQYLHNHGKLIDNMPLDSAEMRQKPDVSVTERYQRPSVDSERAWHRDKSTLNRTRLCM